MDPSSTAQMAPTPPDVGMVLGRAEETKLLTIFIHLIYHLLQLFRGGVLPQHPHHLPQLLGADAAILCPQHEDVKGSLELWRERGEVRGPALQL